MLSTIALLGAFAFGGVLAGKTEPTTLPQSVQQGGFDLSISATQAFPLFSPEGERIWVPGWDPKPTFGSVVPWETNSVWFTVDQDGQRLQWWTIEVDHTSRKADYVYFGDTRAVRVTVRVTAEGESRCRVDVSYLIAATSPAGEHYVTEATAEQMKAKMLHWKERIENALAKDTHVQQ